MLATALDDALRASAATNGVFDPTIADALVAAGYDRTFYERRPDAAAVARSRRPLARDPARRHARPPTRRAPTRSERRRQGTRRRRRSRPDRRRRVRFGRRRSRNARPTRRRAARRAGPSHSSPGALATSGITTRSWTTRRRREPASPDRPGDGRSRGRSLGVRHGVRGNMPRRRRRGEDSVPAGRRRTGLDRAAEGCRAASSRTTTSSSRAAGPRAARLRSAPSRLDDDVVRRAGRRCRRLPSRVRVRARGHPPRG